jgi:hypothetical protein
LVVLSQLPVLDAAIRLPPRASDPHRTLKILGGDLAAIPLARLRDKLERAGFICINCFKSCWLNFGTGPINDAAAMTHCLKNFDFDVYFISSPRCKDLLKYLDAFFRNTTGRVGFFYVGHENFGENVKGVLRWPDNNSMFRRLPCNRATSKE